MQHVQEGHQQAQGAEDQRAAGGQLSQSGTQAQRNALEDL